MSWKQIRISLLLMVLALVTFRWVSPDTARSWGISCSWARGKRRTVRSVLRTFGPKADKKLRPHFKKAGVAYPPYKVMFLGLKEEKQVELWARNRRGKFRWIKTYPIHAASGVAGPKLREGDRQVPEGFYRLIWLHPNSSFHLSIKLNYPSPFDWKHARREGRKQPGSDIFIHGSNVSIGCLAMGDPAIEEIFVLLARVGLRRSRIVIAPWDPRKKKLKAPKGARKWVPGLYRRISRTFSKFRR